jgi:hypothetical protein
VRENRFVCPSSFFLRNSICKKNGINMAWFSQLWTHGKENAFNESESKILRDDRALKSKLQGERSPYFLFELHKC